MAIDIEVIRRDAESGNANAQLKLAQALAHGVGIQQSHEEAARWCLMAAKQGLPEAQTTMADVYRHGIGVQKDEEAARYWQEKSAASCHIKTAATQADNPPSGSVPQELFKGLLFFVALILLSLLGLLILLFGTCGFIFGGFR